MGILTVDRHDWFAIIAIGVFVVWMAVGIYVASTHEPGPPTYNATVVLPAGAVVTGVEFTVVIEEE